ncbi:MAG: hypothetical protein ABJI96_11560 [Paracoccaceae bacterium]
MLRMLLAFGLLLGSHAVVASPVTTVLPNAELRGTATFRYLGFSIYRARLYTPGGAPLNWQQDFGIELKYQRKLSENDLVTSTLREMERIGAPVPIKEQLSVCFDDVGKGDSYLAISDGPDRIGFWRNGQKMCTLSHPQIKERFMAIFVGDDTQSKSFTRKLKNQ